MLRAADGDAGMYDPVDRRDVFISYSSQDEAVAAQLVSRLEASGISCWIARETSIRGRRMRKPFTTRSKPHPFLWC